MYTEPKLETITTENYLSRIQFISSRTWQNVLEMDEVSELLQEDTQKEVQNTKTRV